MFQVEELLESGASLYRAGSELGPAMKALIKESPTADPGPATLRLGQGTWEVILFILSSSGDQRNCIHVLLAHCHTGAITKKMMQV